MSHRLRIAVANCTRAVPAVWPVATRFAAVADVVPLTAATDGSDAEAVVPELERAAPDAIVVFPQVAARLLQTSLAAAPVVPIEIPADVLVGRATAALELADSVAVLPPAGTVSPSSARLLRRLGGTIHVMPYENHAHLHDLVLRCRRMGVRAAIGGQSLASLAEPEGLHAFSLMDMPDETSGMTAQVIMKAAAQAAPRCTARGDELARYGLILEKIAQGAIGPHDITLCVDAGGRVTAAFAPPAANGAGHALTRATPSGLSVMEAVTATAGADAAADEAGPPVALDLYPLAARDGGGYLAVLRGTPRPVASLPGEPAPLDADPRAGRLLERVDTLVERVDALTRARRARRAPRRFLASLRRRTFLLDWDRVRYFELRSGLVYASLATGETYATNYTLADIAARVDARDFFRIHRHVIVNLSYVIELERYGVSQLRVVIEGPDTPSFVVSRPASAALRKLLKY